MAKVKYLFFIFLVSIVKDPMIEIAWKYKKSTRSANKTLFNTHFFIK